MAAPSRPAVLSLHINTSVQLFPRLYVSYHVPKHAPFILTLRLQVKTPCIVRGLILILQTLRYQLVVPTSFLGEATLWSRRRAAAVSWGVHALLESKQVQCIRLKQVSKNKWGWILYDLIHVEGKTSVFHETRRGFRKEKPAPTSKKDNLKGKVGEKGEQQPATAPPTKKTHIYCQVGHSRINASYFFQVNATVNNLISVYSFYSR